MQIRDDSATSPGTAAQRFDRVALVRCAPGDGPGAAMICDNGASTLLFLHGDAAAYAAQPGALAGTGAVALHVCATSWRRRFEGAPPRPFEGSTLAVVLDRVAAESVRIDSYGVGGACCSAAADGVALVEIAFAPVSPRQATETLEWLLAAAALEFDVRVLFSGAGVAHLVGERGRGWRQFTDFGLAELHVDGDAGTVPASVGARPLSAAGAVRLRGEAARVILL